MKSNRPSIPEMFDLKKYPIRTGLAFAFAGSAALVDTGQLSLVAMGATFFCMGVAAHEHDGNKKISINAQKATECLQVVNQAKVARFNL